MAKRKGSVRKPRPGRLRIVAGKWRSRLLPVADHEGLRPTSERVRETLFNWLSDRLAGSHCLDLFAGTGALGFEALSRGAASATFVENSRQVCDSLRHSASTLEAQNARVVQADALGFLGRPASEAFDIVFLDPPFAAGFLEQCCELLQSNGWLRGDACVYLEQDRKEPLPELPDGWRVVKEKETGNVRYALVTLV